jgi:hypothetical protein
VIPPPNQQVLPWLRDLTDTRRRSDRRNASTHTDVSVA